MPQMGRQEEKAGRKAARTTRRPTQRAKAMAMALLVAVPFLPGLARAQESPNEAIAVIDITAESRCRIIVSQYSDPDFTHRIATTGYEPCDGKAAVFRAFPISLSGGGASGTNDYVVRTGDPEADEDAVERLQRRLLPAISAEVPENLDGGGADATRCNSGYYPSYYSFGGRYYVYKYDSPPPYPVDTVMFWSVNVKRTSCNTYQLLNASQQIAQDFVPSQRLWFDEYHYSRYRLVTGNSGPRTEHVCRRHNGTGDASTITRRPDYFPMNPGGTYLTKTTNVAWDGCFAEGETWTGWTTLSLPTS